ncbi:MULTISPECIES: M24 family metallopeptidase [Cobetia]|uniref:Xaa-Pro peptidase family protein n=2 Tax=Gammaproteobacteria TaxID=1236 RepID=A0AAP4TXR2_9GAMM|nr:MULTISPECIES: Xaa-Pro peptidase family protein [Cobetia]KPM80603.1 peptidase M24 [Cobetia sp. UCD-24C]MDO6671620.1 Xaa-Pro peptidase family protein [Cobetia amphilecti]
MNELDWHADRSDLHPLELQDNAPESEGIDLVAVRRYRQNRLREEMSTQGVDALIISDPVNIRYASGARNMQVFSARNTPARYLLLTQHRSVLFEFTGCEHLADGLETIDEVRPAMTTSFVAAGHDIAEREQQWAREMLATITELCGLKAVIGMERMNAGTAIAFDRLGARVVDAQAPLERARAIKSDEELKCVVASLRATERGVGRLREAIRPGITENELWSVLHQSIIADNGDYCETRLLNSGPRTYPWFQETATKRLAANELVALDTDVVGCHGYYSDFSRTFHVGPDKPTETQKLLYRTAHEQVQHNLDILRPGMSFREYSEKAWNIPERFHANRYYLSAHGCGMTGEYPYLYHHADFAVSGYDGVIEPGMVLCVESYIGDPEAGEGVKLEEQCVMREDGLEILSKFPFEEALLN